MTIADAAGHRTRPLAPIRLFVSTPQLVTAIGFSVAAAVFAVPFYNQYSPWVTVGAGLTCFVCMHGMMAVRNVLWIPGVAAFTACLQWVIMPWCAYALQDALPIAPMGIDPDSYFSFAVPATACLILGLYLPGVRKQSLPSEANRSATGSRGLWLTCDAMVFGGLAMRVLVERNLPPSLRFASLLFGQLAYVGAFALLLSRARWWWVRVVAVLAVEAFLNSADAQFLDVVDWTMLAGLVAIFRFRPRAGTILAFATVTAFGVLALNGIKAAFRGRLASEDIAPEERSAIATRSLYDMASEPSAVLGPRNIGFNITRLNQGAIIARVLYWVPYAAPFAEGETISTAVRSALVPRIVDPTKVVAGGYENYKRFTGYGLVGGTSINLSIAGEMYANFGRSGALTGLVIYGLILGALFMLFARLARRSVLAWAWAPYVLISTMSAESGAVEVTNGVSKALLVAFVLTRALPAWRAVGPTGIGLNMRRWSRR